MFAVRRTEAAMEFLERICGQVRERVSARQEKTPLPAVKGRVASAEPVRPFREALGTPGEVSLIAELKKASPSKGLIRADFDVPTLAGPMSGEEPEP